MKRLVIAFTALLFTTALNAEQVRIPIGQQDAMVQKPAHGISSAQVEERFGAPDSKHGPVGDPPILYWEYPEFTVYFEGNRVIHSVSKVKSKNALTR